MNACRNDIPEVLNAIMSSLYVVRRHRSSLMMVYVAVCYTLVNGETIVSSTKESDSNPVTIDRLQAVKWDSPVNQLINQS